MADFTKVFRLLLDSDTRGAIDGLTGFESAAKKAEAITATTGKGISGSFGNIIAKTGLGQKAMETFGISAQTMGTVAVGAVGAAGGAVAKFALDGAKKVGDLGEEVEKFAGIAGTSSETASKWIAVADDYGVSSEAISTAVGKLGKALGTNIHAFDEYGVSVVKAKDGSVDLNSTLFNVIDTYNKTIDPTTKSKLATEAWGKSYQTLIPLLDEGADKIRSSFEKVSEAQILSKDDLKDAEDYRLAMDNLHESVSDFQLTVGKQTIPIIKEFADNVTALTGDLNDLADTLPEVAGSSGLGLLAKGLSFIGGPITTLTQNYDDLKTAIGLNNDYLSESEVAAMDAVTANKNLIEVARQNAIHQRRLQELNEYEPTLRGYIISSIEDQINATDNLIDRYEREQDAIARSVTAGLDLNDAMRSVRQASMDADDAVAAYQRTLEADVDTSAIFDALHELTKAQEDYAKSQEVIYGSPLDKEKAAIALEEAKKRVSEAYAVTTGSDMEKERARLALEEARARPQEIMDEAMARYNKVMKDSKATAEDREKAEHDLGEAVRDREKAELDLKDAEDRYQKVNAEVTGSDLDRRRAIVGLEEAQKAYDEVINGSTASTEEQKDALARLQDAQARYDEAKAGTITSEAEKKQAFLDAQAAIDGEVGSIVNLKEKQAIAEGGTWTYRDSVNATITALQTQEATLKVGSPLWNALEEHIRQLQDIAALAAGYTSTITYGPGYVSGSVGAGTIYGPKAAGGPVSAFSTYRVNERGEEYFTPMSAGYITPAGKWGMSGGGGTIIVNNFHVSPTADQASIGRAIAESLKAYERVSGPGWRN